MCSTSITISEESFQSDFSDLPAQAVNDVITPGLFSKSTTQQHASCRSESHPLDSLVTTSLLDMTRIHSAEGGDIQERSSNFLRGVEEAVEQAELSATILGKDQTK